VEQQVMPWLKEETQKIVARQATARSVNSASVCCPHFVPWLYIIVKV